MTGDLALRIASGDADFARDEFEDRFRCVSCGVDAPRLWTVKGRTLCEPCRDHKCEFTGFGYVCVCGRTRPGSVA